MNAKKIMIVEDETIIAMEIEDRLNKLGYEVPLVTTTGEDAVINALELQPDLILMDIMLRGKMDGVEAAAKIGKKSDIPVIFLTANTDAKTIERAKVTQPYGYLIKPFEEQELKTSIEISIYKNRMERKIRESERWLSATLTNIGEGLIGTDSKGLIKFLNPMAEELTGWKTAEAVGKSLDDVLRTEMVSEDSSVTSPGIQEKKNNTILVSKNKSRIPIEKRTTLIIDDADKISGTITIFRDVSSWKKAEEMLEHLATHDPLTSLPNRALLNAYLSKALARANRNQYFVAILFLDIDNFKHINDQHGHEVGDMLLSEFSYRVNDIMREGDFFARLAGDEFIIVLEDFSENDAVVSVAQKVTKLLNQPFTIKDMELSITSSIGISIYPKDGVDPVSLLRTSDEAMYRVKNSGKNNYTFYSDEAP